MIFLLTFLDIRSFCILPASCILQIMLSTKVWSHRSSNERLTLLFYFYTATSGWITHTLPTPKTFFGGGASQAGKAAGGGLGCKRLETPVQRPERRGARASAVIRMLIFPIAQRRPAAVTNPVQVPVHVSVSTLKLPSPASTDDLACWPFQDMGPKPSTCMKAGLPFALERRASLKLTPQAPTTLLLYSL